MPAAAAIGLPPSTPAPPAGIVGRDIGGVSIAMLDRAGALDMLAGAMADRRHLKLAFCNAHLVNLAATDPGLRTVLDGFLILPDGIGVDLGSRLLHGAPFPANLNGTDFIPALLRTTKRPLRVALVGGRPGIAERAAERWRQEFPAHRFEVLSDGFFSPDDEAGLLDRLSQSPPDLLLVALGNPLQERWITERIGARHATVAAGVGALLDFTAQEVVRAPLLLRRLRLEWLYRLWHEPRRLWRRYLLGNPVFLLRMLKLRLLGASAR